jgi:acetyl-CoA acetyltransferase
MPEILVAGVGMTPFGRLSGHDVKSLTRWAVSEAIHDAGGELRDIEIACLAVNALKAGQADVALAAGVEEAVATATVLGT